MIARWRRSQNGLKEHGWDGLLATPSVNFTHLTGVSLWRTERLTCLGVPRDGEPWVVCPAFERDHLASQIEWAKVIGWEETDPPFAVAAAQIESGGGGIWGVEPSTAYHDAERLAAATSARLVDGASLFERLRRSKDGEEVALLERTIEVAWTVFSEVVGALETGQTERVVGDRFIEAFRQHHAEGWALVQFGPGSSVPHGEPSGRALTPGQSVLIDWGGWLEGFSADLTRSFWWDDGIVAIADAPPEYRTIHELVRQAQAAGLGALGPGAIAGDVDEASRSVIRRAGHGEHFTHRLGHGLGREIHEPPYLVADSETVIAPGDVVTVEPGVYLPEHFGVRWEDDVLVTESGIDVLSLRGECYAGVELSDASAS
jgi:Xaa-Pro aminopeptidase